MPKSKSKLRTRAADPNAKVVKASPAANRSFPIVGIGASAGGLEAITQLLKQLPADTGLALVLVQHLDPTHESALTSILARSTSLSVAEAQNNMRLHPNRVYVIPPNKLMGVSAGRLKLSPRSDADTPHAIDHFFHTLAEDHGRLAIGVVLSGNGADGTQGLLAIKAAGGITFAQEERTAKYPAMPGSAITAGCVDFVLPPNEIGHELGRLAGHPYVAPLPADAAPEHPAQENALDPILLVLRQRMGVDFTHYKRPTLLRRIERRMALHKLHTHAQYARQLRSHPAEAKELYDDILIHVTGFFRDRRVFQVLKKRVLPRLVKAREPEDPIRIWVPGCSTGEEVYSLAIAITEYLADRKSAHRVQIFATDIHDGALGKAREGFYPVSIRADVSEERLRRFFTRGDGGYRVNKNLREMCIFARQNVAADPPFSNLDLISCRNVLIYLDQTLQRKVLPLFHYALRTDGYLLLGGSEAVGSFGDLFVMVDNKAKLYTRKPTFRRPAVNFGTVLPGTPTKSLPAAAPAAPLVTSAADVQRQADRVLLTHFSPAGAIINRNLEVLQFRGQTGPYLEHPQGEASLNILKMAREGLALDLRTVISKALKHDARFRQERVGVKHEGRDRKLSLEVIPFSVPPITEKFYLVLFQPTEPRVESGPSRKRKSSKAQPVASTAAAGEAQRLQEELAATRESLQAIIEEQEATNEELRSANEEITSSNEELQSTNEELETAKEELQSTNEELTTLNDELESRNSELQAVNNDLHNLLVSANIPIIILGPDLRIRRFTGMAERTLNLIPGDVGRPITDINLPFNMPNFKKHVLEVIDTLATRELEVQCDRGRWWSVRIRPYKTTDNKIDGAVIAVVDIDALKKDPPAGGQDGAASESTVPSV